MASDPTEKTPGTAPSSLRIDRFLSAPQLDIGSVACRAGASGCSAEEPVGSPRIILPRRGLFIYHLHHAEFVADANSVFLLDACDVCRVSHPIPGGDDCIVLVPDPALLEEAFGERRWLDETGARPRFRAKRLASDPRSQLALWTLHAGLDALEEPLFAEEAAMRLLDHLARMSPEGLAEGPPERFPQRGYIEQARAFLAASPCGPVTLDAIGKAVHCSPFHLARHFRQATGFTLHRYLTAQRMNQALLRLAAGEEDLARLAVDLGFAHHSHFSSRFRAWFGIPPNEARNLLTRRRLSEMRRILTARHPPDGLRS